MLTLTDKKRSGNTSNASGKASTFASRTKKPGRSTSDTVIEQLPLKEYQLTGVKWLLQNPFAGIFLDPGLGKTLIILTAFYLLRRAGFVDWMLVVAPPRPAWGVWPEEVKKWKFPFKVAMLHGPKKESALLEEADIYVTTYDSVEWLHPKIEALTKRGIGWLVADESTKVKRLKSLRHKFLDAIVQCFGRRAILTGTPIPNGYDDLFGQIKVLDLGQRLGRFIADYRTTYMVQDGSSMGKRFVPKNKEAVKAIELKIRDICLRFSDKDLGLKRWNSHVIRVKLPLTARQIYSNLELSMVANLVEGTIQAVNPGVLTTKLRQVASGGVYLDDELQGRINKQLHDAKTDAVEDLIEELGGKPLMIAYEFEHDLARLRARFGDIPAIKGKVSMKNTLRIMAEFNEGKHPILAAQEGAVALGLNLQKKCCNIAWYTITWNLENYIQAIKRIHRQGQKNQVHVYHLVAEDTVDERVMEVIKGKDRTQRALLNALRRYHLGGQRVSDSSLSVRRRAKGRRTVQRSKNRIQHQRRSRRAV